MLLIKRQNYKPVFLVIIFSFFFLHHSLLILHQVALTFNSTFVKNFIYYYRGKFNEKEWYLFHKIPEKFYRIEVRYKQQKGYFSEYKDYTATDVKNHADGIWGLNEKQLYIDRWFNISLGSIYDLKNGKKIDENKVQRAEPKILSYLKQHADGAPVGQWRLVKWYIVSKDSSKRYSSDVRLYQSLVYESAEIEL